VKDKTMDNVQNSDTYINIPSSQMYRSYSRLCQFCKWKPNLYLPYTPVEYASPLTIGVQGMQKPSTIKYLRATMLSVLVLGMAALSGLKCGRYCWCTATAVYK
jgi:hypothetical protein